MLTKKAACFTISVANLLLPLVAGVETADGGSAPVAEATRLPEGGQLPAFTVEEPRVAIIQPVETFVMPVSGLRYEPQVDVQERNVAEGQADVTIRGGIFEATGFKLGAATIFDAQTGHYFAELPVAPAMLTPPRVLTGAANAVEGFNSTAGTIQWFWAPVSETGGSVTVGGGDNSLNFQSLYGSYVRPETLWGGITLAMDAAYARSESDGTLAFGDHDFERFNLRAQARTERSQTDLFAGYQDKFFGWPGMYTGNDALQETENLQTTLFLANHRQSLGPDGGFIEFTGYYRRHKDDYEVDRDRPGLVNAFQHETRVGAAALRGEHPLAQNLVLTWAGQVTSDDIDSTSLENGPFTERTYAKLSVLPRWRFERGPGVWTLEAGGAFDDSDRDSAEFSPIARIELARDAGSGTNRYFTSFAKTTQVPGYTALGSVPGGLFGGNPNLGREEAYNLEAGVALERAGWALDATVFHRWDRDLVDWTFSTLTPGSRDANAVDIDNLGIELVFTRNWRAVDLILGYTYLTKSEDYGAAGPGVDASFYAGNFANHRITAAVIWRLSPAWEVRADNEFRDQAPNSIREGETEPLFTSLGIVHRPPGLEGIEFTVAVDNLWDERFEEVPGTPGAGRQVAASASWRF